MNELERLAQRGDERGAGTVFERATNGPAVSDRTARPLVLAGAAVVVAVAVLAALVLRDVDDPPQDLVADVPPPNAVFYAETDTTLLFDDGDAGIVSLDLDNGALQPRPIGNQAGDQPYRLLRTANRLVVGWRQVRSVPWFAESVELGTDSIALPAIEAGSVWVAGVNEPRTITRQSVVDGSILEGPYDVPSGATPVRGVAGGVAYETANGIVVIDANGVLGDELGRVLGDAKGSLVIVGDTAGTMATIVDLGTDRTVGIEPDAPIDVVDVRGARFAPDGGSIALVIGADIVLVDSVTGERTIVEQDVAGPIHLGWSDDGTQLFWSSDSFGRTATTLGRFEVATGDSQHRDVDRGGLGSFVAVPTEVETSPNVASFGRGETGPPAFAPEVALLLGREEIATRPRAELLAPSAWLLDVEGYAGYTGPFSALHHLAIVPPGDLALNVGPRDRCAGPPLPAPTDFDYDEHLVYTPVGGESCLDWFAVEVFALDGEIVAVSLDLWEP